MGRGKTGTPTAGGKYELKKPAQIERSDGPIIRDA